MRQSKPRKASLLALALVGPLALGCGAAPDPTTEPESPAAQPESVAMATEPDSDRPADPTALPATAAPSPSTEPSASPTPLGPLAPELQATDWLNSEPISIADLRGKVVMIDFWTFG